MRRSGSQAIVPKVGQRRKTKSSMPMTLSSSHRATPYDPQEGVVAHGHHQALGKSCFRPAAKHQTELVHDHPKPLSTLAVPGQNTSIELLAKDAPPANNDVTPKTTRLNHENNPSAAMRKIRWSAHTSTFHAATWSTAVGTSPYRSTRPQQDVEMLTDAMNRCDHDTVRALKLTVQGRSSRWNCQGVSHHQQK